MYCPCNNIQNGIAPGTVRFFSGETQMLTRNFFIRLKAGIICLVLIFSVSLGALGNPTPEHSHAQQISRAPRPFPSAKYIPDHDYDTRHIALDLRFDWDQEQAIATETLTFSPLVKDLRT